MTRLSAEFAHRSIGGHVGGVVRFHWRDLTIYVCLVALGVGGDLASGAAWPFSVLWAGLLPQLHYLGVIFSATRFGISIGLASACLAAIAHEITTSLTQGWPGFDGAHLVMLVAVALTAGWFSARGRSAGESAVMSTNTLGDFGSNAPFSELGRMMPDLVHQLRTPIASIDGAGFVLGDADLSYDRREEFIGIIRKECRRLELLVELLDFTQTRISTEREVDLARLLDEVISLCQPKAATGLVLRNATRPDLPRLRTDSRFLRQVVHAVTADAIDVVHRHGELELSADLMPNEVLIQVDALGENLASDTGFSIDYKRSEIDLAVVRQLVNKHGGSVTVQPDNRGGVMFSIVLPRNSS